MNKSFGGANPTLTEAITAAMESMMEGVRFCLPGQIESYDPSTRKASVKPLIKRVYADATVNALPVIDAVPVVWPAGSGGAIAFPLKRGDGVLLLFSERNMENFLVQGGDSIPNDGRKFDLTDCIAIPGLYPFNAGAGAPDNSNAWFTFNGNSVQLGSDGSVTVKSKGGAELKLGADGKIAIGNQVLEFMNFIDSVLAVLSTMTLASVTSGATATAIATLKTEFETALKGNL